MLYFFSVAFFFHSSVVDCVEPSPFSPSTLRLVAGWQRIFVWFRLVLYSYFEISESERRRERMKWKNSLCIYIYILDLLSHEEVITSHWKCEWSSRAIPEPTSFPKLREWESSTIGRAECVALSYFCAFSSLTYISRWLDVLLIFFFTNMKRYGTFLIHPIADIAENVREEWRRKEKKSSWQSLIFFNPANVTRSRRIESGLLGRYERDICWRNVKCGAQSRWKSSDVTQIY